jgi:hypothetical protein
MFTIPTEVLMVIHFAIEDQILQDELQAYKETAQEVKFHLLPEMW